ncbi:Protein kinase domain-containing protein [Salix suchowensis]|nr:Protein kinase domain-containing protein [Salix suchowensis]
MLSSGSRFRLRKSPPPDPRPSAILGESLLRCDATYSESPQDREGPPRIDIQAIKNFLRRQMNPLTKAHDHTSSDETRVPAIWDMHLDVTQTLQRVEPFDDLIKQLGDLTEQYLVDTGNLFTNDNAGFRDLDASKAAPVRDENGVIEHYEKTVGTPCSRVTSFLLGGSEWRRPIVCWHRYPLRKQGQAIADGYLRFDIAAIEDSKSLSPSMKAKLLRTANRFPELAVYEFKSLRFAEGATFDVIQEILAKGAYDWIRCNPDECKASHYKGGRPQTTGARMGLDAEGLDAGNGPFFLPPKPNANGRGRKRGRETDDPTPPYRMNASAGDWQHAHSILQQVYAEAVAQDASFLVLQCGNKEVIGFRNRKYQTLHLSGVHELAATTGPGYMQIHVGLYLAIILDAVERASALERATKVPATWADDWYQSTTSKRIQFSPEADVYLKLARSESKRAKLLHEYNVCRQLRLTGIRGVPDVIGCFSYQESARTTADETVASGCAADLHILAMISVDGGYLHGKIRAEHVLVDGRKAMMLSFGHAAPYSLEGASSEIEELHSLLNEGRKRRRHFPGPPEKVVVIESSAICQNAASLFASLTSHVALMERMLTEKGICRVLHEERGGNPRFTIYFHRGTRAAIAFAKHWLEYCPSDLRHVGCEVRDIAPDGSEGSKNNEGEVLSLALLSDLVVRGANVL